MKEDCGMQSPVQGLLGSMEDPRSKGWHTEVPLGVNRWTISVAQTALSPSNLAEVLAELHGGPHIKHRFRHFYCCVRSQLSRKRVHCAMAYHHASACRKYVTLLHPE
jgi:hypothetical protein